MSNSDADILSLIADDDTSNEAKRSLYISQHLQKMNEAELTRFEFFIRSHFKRSTIKDILHDVNKAAKISDDIVTVVNGVSKLFLAELVDTAKDVLKERGETGNLKPHHIMESYRRMQLERKIEGSSSRNFLFGDVGFETRDIFAEMLGDVEEEGEYGKHQSIIASGYSIAGVDVLSSSSSSLVSASVDLLQHEQAAMQLNREDQEGIRDTVDLATSGDTIAEDVAPTTSSSPRKRRKYS